MQLIVSRELSFVRTTPVNKMPREFNINEKTPLLTNKSDAVLVFADVDEWEQVELNDSQALTLEELLLYKDHPLWMQLRQAIFYSFWITLIMIFLAACLLSYLHADTCSVANNVTIPSFERLNQTAIMAP